MKTRTNSLTAMGGMDATVSNNNEVFAKQKLQRIKLTWMSILFAILTLSLLALASCGDDTPETFTVKFEANGGTPAPQAQTVTKGGKVTTPTAMTKADSAFGGWYKESANTNQWNFAADTVTANITLYAKWIPLEFKIEMEGYPDVTVKDERTGTLTKSLEELGIIEKLKTALDGAKTVYDSYGLGAFDLVMDAGGLKIIVDNPENSYTDDYETIEKSIHLDISFLTSATDEDIARALTDGIYYVSSYIESLALLNPNTDIKLAEVNPTTIKQKQRAKIS